MLFLKKLKARVRFPLLALPAVAVTAFSLFALLSVTVEAAVTSQPGDLLYPLRQPALQIQEALTFGAGTRPGIDAPLAVDEPELGHTDDTVASSGKLTDDQRQPMSTFVGPLTATPTTEPTEISETEEAEEPEESSDDGDEDNSDDNDGDDSDDNGDDDNDDDDDDDDDDGDD